MQAPQRVGTAPGTTAGDLHLSTIEYVLCRNVVVVVVVVVVGVGVQSTNQVHLEYHDAVRAVKVK